MCGFLSWVSRSGSVDRDALNQGIKTIEHRGPDGIGRWIDHSNRIGLAHARLAIVDLAQEANQPMCSADGRYELVYNGEIYNHVEIRQELESLGCVFKTDHSDTEVLLVAYAEWGLDETLRRLNGMFSFVIFDAKRNKLVGARDRIGIKPFYYFLDNKQFVASSEIKAVLQIPGVGAELAQENLGHHLAFRALPAPLTLFKNIYKLGPGQSIELDVESLTVTSGTYWDPLQEGTGNRTEDQALEELTHLLESSIRYRLRSDVPVGVFLSGGLDSALVTAKASDHATLDAFTIHYPGFDAYNEQDGAAIIASKFDARFWPIESYGVGYASVLEDVAYHQDEPIAAPVCASVYLLSQAARKRGVPVILTGEGADELFIGYRNWQLFKKMQTVNDAVPDTPARLFRRAMSRMTGLGPGKAAKLHEIAARSRYDAPLFWAGGMDFTGTQCEQLSGIANAQERTYEEIIAPAYRRFKAAGRGKDDFGWMIYQDMQLRLPELMLMRLDKMTMAFGIEGRVPLLDHRMASLMLSLPNSLRDKAVNETKWMLKRVAQESLDRDFIYQRKRGFQAPVKEWRDGSLFALANRLQEFSRRTGVLNPKAVAKVVNAKNSRLYFSLINFMLWYERFIETSS